MSYCRFENTSSDLLDCREHILDKLTGDYEPRARVQLVRLCADILEQVGFSVTDNDNEQPISKDLIKANLERFCQDNDDDDVDDV
jgi:hypothetical protein